MAHKTLIGGTAYEISGGKTLVDGTAYSIDKGKTMVGGTVYEVGFRKFVPLYDFGTFTTDSYNSNTGLYFKQLYTNYTSWYKNCTAIVINGVEYELDEFNNSGYGVKGNSPIQSVTFMQIMTSYSIMFWSKSQSTYTVQIGCYE